MHLENFVVYFNLEVFLLLYIANMRNQMVVSVYQKKNFFLPPCMSILR